MEPVDQVSHVMQALRRRMAENMRALRGAGRVPYQGDVELAGAAEPPTSTLRREIARRLKLVAPDDPRHRHKSAATFVEVVLLAELGEQMVNSVGFRNLVEDVCEAMIADPAIEADLSAVLKELRNA